MSRTPKGKRQLQLNEKRLALLEGISQGLNISAAGRQAGYAAPQSAHRALTRMYLQVPGILKRLGMPVEKVLKNFIAKTKAKETVLLTHQGRLKRKVHVEAHDIQLRANIELAKMHHLYPPSRDANGDSDRPAPRVFNLVIADAERAEAILERLAGGSRNPGRTDLDVRVDKDEG